MVTMDSTDSECVPNKNEYIFIFFLGKQSMHSSTHSWLLKQRQKALRTVHETDVSSHRDKRYHTERLTVRHVDSWSEETATYTRALKISLHYNLHVITLSRVYSIRDRRPD